MTGRMGWLTNDWLRFLYCVDRDYLTSTQKDKTLFGYFQPGARKTTGKTAKALSALEDRGNSSDRDEVEVV